MSTDTKSQAVVTALVDAGLLDRTREDEAGTVVRAALAVQGEAAAAPLRRRMAEIAGYVGGAFVVGAAILFFSSTWSDLTVGAQAALLLAAAAVLAVAGIGFVRGAGGPAALAAPAESVRRRLSSVLFTGAAGCTGFALGLLLVDALSAEELGLMLAALAAAGVALVGYVVAPSTVGQLGTAVSALVAIPSGLSAVTGTDPGTLPFGLLVLALGAVWLGAAERGLWHEPVPARVIGCVLVVVGAQIPVAGDASWVGYLLTAAAGGVAFWLYVVRRAWPYLATGVVAVTIAVPEAVNDWVGGSLGAAGVLLATGVTLLVAALLGLRLRQEVQEGDGSHRLAH